MGSLGNGDAWRSPSEMHQNRAAPAGALLAPGGDRGPDSLAGSLGAPLNSCRRLRAGPGQGGEPLGAPRGRRKPAASPPQARRKSLKLAGWGPREPPGGAPEPCGSGTRPRNGFPHNKQKRLQPSLSALGAWAFFIPCSVPQLPCSCSWA